MDHRRWIFVILATFLLDIVYSLRILRLFVPNRAAIEQQIDCHYDLEGDRLYNVKWYKDGKEFFRCEADGKTREFEVDGVSLYYSDYAKIGSCPVTLTGLTSLSEGEYLCEVSLDAPTFKIVSDKRILKIYKKIETRLLTQLGNVQNEKRNSERDTSSDKYISTHQSIATRSSISSFFVLLLYIYFYFIM